MDLHEAYERARTDPGFLRAFATLYRGAHQPLDALLWAAHPEQPGPSGAPAPWADRRSLEEAAYSEGSDAARREAALRQLDTLDGEAAAERDRVQAAIASAEDGEAGSSVDPGLDEIEDSARSERASEQPAGDLSRPALRSRRRLGIAAAAVLLVGVGVGWLGSNLADGSLTRGIGAAAPAPGASLAADIDDLFDRPQRASDVPTSVIFAQIGGISDIDVDSARALDLGLNGEAVLNHAYIAKANEGDVCVFLTHDDGRIARSCATPGQFAVAGLSISWTTTENFREGRPPEPSAVGISIGPDGSIVPVVTRYFYLGGSVTDEDGLPHTTESPTPAP
ncbi:hypothetical protein [Naasia lichenicola]|uniref:Uncharacterized protein n=1 Tax=Naasia lichenicola TaxID=2565933 RepID=A0A4S4FRA8_9MICO|nr:hypothetical protein [Naasia lichenicola]THG32904.1 hypothetical protein E6C64_00580 [Naasia lichenicola]